MQYKVVKHNAGSGKGSTLVAFKTEQEILDTSFHQDFGIMFIEKDNPSVSLIDFKGNIISDWVGKKADPRCQNGPMEKARLTSPCSICSNDQFLFIIEDDGNLIRILDLKNKYMENYSGKKYEQDFKGYLFNRKKPKIKSAASEFGLFFVNDISNKIFCVSYGNIDKVIGDGKARFSVSNEYTRSSFNRPSGVCVVDDKIYVSDTNNHCIRKIVDNSVEVFLGKPWDTEPSNTELLAPSKLSIKRNMVFILDDNTIKITNLNSKKMSVTYKANMIESFEADSNRNVYIFERE